MSTWNGRGGEGEMYQEGGEDEPLEDGDMDIDDTGAFGGLGKRKTISMIDPPLLNISSSPTRGIPLHTTPAKLVSSSLPQKPMLSTHAASHPSSSRAASHPPSSHAVSHPPSSCTASRPPSSCAASHPPSSRAASHPP
ncbi:hypothetical protein BU15DRAFT_80443 [Melanogaster broomeanus]|nr:hypothetical protein BU15DRAFT_80443 [Melanogaster broomeanus]